MPQEEASSIVLGLKALAAWLIWKKSPYKKSLEQLKGKSFLLHPLSQIGRAEYIYEAQDNWGLGWCWFVGSKVFTCFWRFQTPDTVFMAKSSYDCRQLQTWAVCALLRFLAMVFIFPGMEFWWPLGGVVFLVSRQGMWVHHSILRLSSWVIVELCLNWRTSRETEDMLIKKSKPTTLVALRLREVKHCWCQCVTAICSKTSNWPENKGSA